MSKLDKNFKREVDNEIREGSYIAWKIGIRIVIVIVILSVLCILGNITIKKFTVEKNREIFKKSVTYTESAASFLADSYRQYNKAENDAEKNTIMEYVIMRYPNLDMAEIDNYELKNFYNNCLKGGN